MKDVYKETLTREQAEKTLGTYTTRVYCPNCGDEKELKIPCGTSVVSF